MKKNWTKKITALGATAMLCFSFCACGGGETATVDGYAYLAVDINPTVEFVLVDGRVSSVNAVNDDAAVLISGVDFTDMTAEEVTQKVVELAEDMGYLTEENAGVKISVATDDETAENKLKEWAVKGAKKASELAKVNDEPRSADERTSKKLKKENAEKYKDLDAVKVRLIEAVMQFDETMTYEIGAEMSVEALADLLEDYMHEYKEYAGETLKKEYKDNLREKREETERQMAEIYGAEYLAEWEKYVALEKAYELIEFSAKNVTVSAEDLQALGQLFAQVGDWTAQGEVLLEEVDEYMDKVFDNAEHIFEGKGGAFEDAKKAFEKQMELVEKQVEELLEKYDADNYVLTADDITAIQAIYADFTVDGEWTLEDLEEYVEEKEDALEQLKESITLTEDQKAQLSALRDGFKEVKEDLHEEWKDDVDSAKEYFKDWKDFRHEHKMDGEDFHAPEFPKEGGDRVEEVPQDSVEDSVQDEIASEQES
ncbi:MAG: hypothetical protein IJ996_00625 [Clostridia bacterium]|nr:hypothetical protein [Clostridia bacterium]